MEERYDLSPEEAARNCEGALPHHVIEGLALFNRGAYFEAHEALELAWRAESGPAREVYRGILQVGVAYYHIQHGNYPGAVKLIARAQNCLAPFPNRCRGIDLEGLRANAHQVEDLLRRLGPEGLAAFDAALFRPIDYGT